MVYLGIVEYIYKGKYLDDSNIGDICWNRII